MLITRLNENNTLHAQAAVQNDVNNVNKLIIINIIFANSDMAKK